MIRNGNKGWELVEFSRQIPTGRNPRIIERFVYERFNTHGESCGRAVGYRTEGHTDILFQENLT